MPQDPAFPPSEDFIAPAAQPPPLPARIPLVWPALLIGPLAIATAIIIGGIFSFVALAISGGISEMMSGGDLMADLNALTAKLFETPLGALLIILPGQVVFLGGAIAATKLSPVPWRERLGFKRSRVPIWSWPILALGTFFIAVVAGLTVETAFPENLEQLKLFSDIAKAGGPGVAVFNGLMLSLLPGFAEETMFRGYIQTRLLQRWPVWAAIGFSSFIFAVAHFDPVHILAVLPIGIWLGVVAWRARSVYPCMFCHACMNGLSMIAGRFSESEKTEWNSAAFIFLGVTGFAFLLAIGIVKRYGARTPVEHKADDLLTVH